MAQLPDGTREHVLDVVRPEPDRIGRYRIEGQLGRGGFATVYRARDDALDADVAVKVLAAHWSVDGDVRGRFVQEARLLRRAGGEHVVPIHDIGQLPDARPYFVMDLADRGTLQDRLEGHDAAGHSVALEDALDVAEALALALDGLHRVGIVHRDVKPSNVLILRASVPETDGADVPPAGADGRDAPPSDHGPLLGTGERLVLGDLGLAKDLAATGTGLSFAGGSPGYMAPEQTDPAAPVDERADIYGSSALLVRILTGRPPGPGSVRPMPDAAPHVDPLVWGVLRRGLLLDPGGRHPSIRDWVTDLRRAAGAVGRRPTHDDTVAWSEADPPPDDASSSVVSANPDVEQLRRRLGQFREVLDNVATARDPGDDGPVDLLTHLIERLDAEVPARLRAGGAEAARVRDEIDAELRRTAWVEPAMATSNDHVLGTLAESVAALALTDATFGWLQDRVRPVLEHIGARQAVQLGLQRQQINLQREQLAKTNLLLTMAVSRGMSADHPRSATALLDDDRSTVSARSPFKGLQTFQFEDADLFFGREALVAELVGRLAEARMLAVVGASGSGKSSLLRAGLLPALSVGARPGGASWRSVIFTPGDAPLDALATRLAALGGVAATSLRAELRSDAQAIGPAIERALLGEPPGTRLLLVIDQFEEIYSQCRDEFARQQFIAALLAARDDPEVPAAVAIVIRADFYQHLAAVPRLASAVQDDQVLVGPMREAELRAAVERPAELVGLRLEDRLTDTIVDDVVDEPGALPLLSHALLETWRRRTGSTLRLDDYLSSGGVRQAIARTADALFTSLPPDEQALVQAMLLRLTQLDDHNVSTRRTVSVDELLALPGSSPTAVRRVLDALVDARLVTVDGEAVQVAHEALLRAWPRLRRWLEADRESLQVHRRLTEAAMEWVAADRDPDWLYTGARLAAADEWARAHEGRLNTHERGFLEASRAAERTELEQARRRQRRLFGLVVALAGVVALSGIITVFALSQRARARDQAVRAEQQTRIAQSRELAAQANDAFDAQFDLALLLGLEAHHIAPTRAARDRLLAGVRYGAALRRYLRGHTDSVNSTVASADGSMLVTASADGSVRLWDASTLQAIGSPMVGHREGVATATFSADGNRVASAGYDGTVRVWDAATQQLLGQPLTGHDDSVHQVAFSPDGRLLASGAGDGTVRIWNAETMRAVGEPIEADNAGIVRTVAFSPDGRTIASGGADGSIHLWNARSRREIGEPLDEHDNWVREVAFSPDGTRLASVSSDRTLRIWDVEEQTPIGDPYRGHAARASTVSFSPDGGLVASGDEAGQVRLWDVEAGIPVGQPLTGHADAVWQVAFTPDNETLITSSGDTTVLLWDLPHLRPLGRHDNWARAVAFGPQGRVLASSSSDQTVQLWDVEAREPIGDPLTGHDAWVATVAFSPDGRLVASGDEVGEVRLWDPADGAPVGEPLVGHAGAISQVAFDPNGGVLASGSSDQTIRLWDVDAGREAAPPLMGQDSDVRSVVFSPDGDVIASGGTDGSVLLWDVNAGDPLDTPLEGHEGTVFQVAFSPDGRQLASAGADRTVRIWDVDRRRLLRVLEGHEAPVRALAFSETGDVLASGSDDLTVRFWDAETGAALGDPVTRHADALTGLAFSPDGTVLASSSADQTVRLWPRTYWQRDVAAQRRRLCAIVGRNLSAAEWERFRPREPYHRTCAGWPRGGGPGAAAAVAGGS